VIIDGGEYILNLYDVYKFRDAPAIANDAAKSRGGEEGADGKLSPESIAKVGSFDGPSS
jgi:hypothetical protein